MQPRKLRAERLEPRVLLAGDFQMIADVNTAFAPLGSSPTSFVSLGDQTLFFATTGELGRELWRTDGTPEGTVLVKDINPGAASAILHQSVVDPPQLVRFGDAVYFRATDGVSGFELWRTDGAEAGTVRVKDIALGPADGVSKGTSGFLEVAGSLYFAASDGVHGFELWKTDGTELGTVLVHDGFAGSGGLNPTGFVNYNGVLIYRGSGGTTNLWRSDGTAAGTSKVSNLNFQFGADPSAMVEANGFVFFSAANGATGHELWRTDGTSAGTVLVKDIYPLSGSSQPDQLTAVGNTLYFAARHPTSGRELWKSDGTAAGTVLVKDTALSGDGFSLSVGPPRMIAFDNRLYFIAGPQLWVSDGTDVGTIRLDGIFYEPMAFSAVDDRLYLASGRDGMVYVEAGATTIHQVAAPPGPNFAAYTAPYQLGDQLYFTGELNGSGHELLNLVGQQPTANLFKDIRQGTLSSNPENLVQIGNTVYFGVFIDEPELWKTDGTAAGTVRVKTFDGYFVDDKPFRLTSVGETLYFVVRHLPVGHELWKSDGTEEGTVLVKDINPGPADTLPDNLTNFNGVLYFTASDPVHGNELWRSDGTEAGTHVLVDINPGSADGVEFSNAFSLRVHQGVMYFAGGDPDHGAELWRSDGTVAGTYMLKEFTAGPVGTRTFSFGYAVSVGDYLYFANLGYVPGGYTFSIWRTDGTEEGTIEIGVVGQLLSLFEFRGELYVIAERTQSPQYSLWKQAEGQLSLVTDLGDSFGDVTTYAVANDWLYIGRDFVDFGDHRLWKSDGTTEGTTPVPLPEKTAIISDTDLVAVDGAVYFLAETNRVNTQVWRVDSSGLPAAPISSFQSYGEPEDLTAIAGQLYFTYDDGIHGRELWRYQSSPGDYWGDDGVDGHDFLFWQRQLGSNQIAGAGADGDHSGYVDGADLDLWRQSFQQPESPAIALLDDASIAFSKRHDLFPAGAFVESAADVDQLAQKKAASRPHRLAETVAHSSAFDDALVSFQEPPRSFTDRMTAPLMRRPLQPPRIGDLAPEAVDRLMADPKDDSDSLLHFT